MAYWYNLEYVPRECRSNAAGKIMTTEEKAVTLDKAELGQVCAPRYAAPRGTHCVSVYLLQESMGQVEMVPTLAVKGMRSKSKPLTSQAQQDG